MEIIGLSDQIKEAKDEYRRELKRYESYNKTSYYRYETKYPHAGAGKRVQF